MNHPRSDLIRARLTDQLQPVEMELIDESAAHAGHRPEAAVGGTHYRLRIVSPLFAGKRLVERHRMVYALIQDLMDEGLHAIAITALTPEEAQK